MGEPSAERRAVVEWTAPLLPADRPRYLMGVGYPEDILHAVLQGVDLFDCVLPASNARHGVLFTREGVLKIKNARFRDDPAAARSGVRLPGLHPAQLARLPPPPVRGPASSPRAVLATLHNLRFYLDFMAGLRQAIALGTLTELASTLAPPVVAIPPDEPDLELPDARIHSGTGL